MPHAIRLLTALAAVAFCVIAPAQAGPQDGKLDIYQVNGYGDIPYGQLTTKTVTAREVPKYKAALKQYLNQSARLFMGTGKAKFAEQAVTLGAAADGEGRGVSCFDYDRDGDIDLFVVDHVGASKLLRNNARSLNRNHFVNIRLWQRQANPRAIGARVEDLAIPRDLDVVEPTRHRSTFAGQEPTVGDRVLEIEEDPRGPASVLARRGLGLADYSRLVRHWAKAIASSPELARAYEAARDREAAQRAPSGGR